MDSVRCGLLSRSGSMLKGGLIVLLGSFDDKQQDSLSKSFSLLRARSASWSPLNSRALCDPGYVISNDTPSELPVPAPVFSP